MKSELDKSIEKLNDIIKMAGYAAVHDNEYRDLHRAIHEKLSDSSGEVVIKIQKGCSGFMITVDAEPSAEGDRRKSIIKNLATVLHLSKFEEEKTPKNV